MAAIFYFYQLDEGLALSVAETQAAGAFESLTVLQHARLILDWRQIWSCTLADPAP